MTLNNLLFNNTFDQVPVISHNEDVSTTTINMFNSPVDLAKIYKPSLMGGDIKPILRLGDVYNAISVGTASEHKAGSIFKESIPYYKEYNDVGALKVIPSWHFLTELRRQLSGDIVDGTSTFSPEETQFYLDFQEWQFGATKTGELLTALEYLDDWLVDELTGAEHPTLDRTYSSTHKWNKTLLRGVA